jgi:hypothetical protein
MSRNALASGLSFVLVSEPDASAFRLINVSAVTPELAGIPLQAVGGMPNLPVRASIKVIVELRRSEVAGPAWP